jgi:hypothetical protein
LLLSHVNDLEQNGALSASWRFAMSRRFRRDCLLTACLSFVTIATVWADSEGAVDAAPTTPAVATDLPVAPPLSSQDVAREVLRLQEEMGGSITQGFEANATWEAPLAEPTGQPQSQPLPTESPVRALREVAWQLDQSAYLLESLDLYEQADSLRKTAAILRGDARKMKTITKVIKSN